MDDILVLARSEEIYWFELYHDKIKVGERMMLLFKQGYEVSSFRLNTEYVNKEPSKCIGR